MLQDEARDLSEALDRLPGLRVTRVGGHGGTTRVMVRGASPQQSMVTLGDIPLRSASGRPVDLEAIPKTALAGLELWRSRAPGSLGDTPIGGVIRLRPRRRGSEVRAGLGSYGVFALEGRWGWSKGSGLSLGWLTSAGDYPYLHNAGTPLNPKDDRVKKRRNNRVQRISGLLRQRFALGQRWRGSLVWLGAWRSQGLPGLAAAEAVSAALDAHTHNVILRAQSRRKGHAKEVWLRGGLERQQVTDELGELGPAQSRIQTLKSVDAGFRWRRSRGVGRPRAAIALRLGHAQTEDLLVDRSSPSAWQAAATGSAGADVRLGRLRLSPTVRGQALWSRRFIDESWTGRWERIDVPARVLGTAELGAGYRLAPWWRLSAGLAIANRPPTIVELYGNDGTVRPQPKLKDERATTLTLATTLRASPALLEGIGLDRIEASLNVFASDRTDLIQLVRAGPGQAIYTNIGSAMLAGAELSGALTWGQHVRLKGGWSLLHARDETDAYKDTALPLRPATRWHLSAVLRRIRLLAHTFVGARIAAAWQAGTFADRANLLIIPARSQLDASLHVQRGNWRIAARFDNVLDTAQFDRVGLPLPGRTWMLNLVWRPRGAN